MRRLWWSLLAVLVGWVVAGALQDSTVAHTSWYAQMATLLLAIGLFASTHAISLAEARTHLRLTLVAVTLGVVVKATLIAGVMLLLFRRPEYLVIGVAVAQIDPLSVATQVNGRYISRSAKTILYSWASFDDPVTVLLAVYLSAFVLGGGNAVSGHGLVVFLLGLGPNAIVVAVAAAWTRIRRRAWAREAAGWPDVVFVALLLGGAAHYSLMLGVAVSGLFLRPPAIRGLDRVTSYAYYTAAVMLGLVLVHGLPLLPGAALGVSAFVSQIIVGRVITRGLAPRDRRYLMLAQQNGITAIVLALVLEVNFPGTVGVIALAVLVVNVLNGVTNSCSENGPGVLLAPFTLLVPFRIVRQRTAAASRAGRLSPAPPTPLVAPAQPAHQAVPGGQHRP
jgi:NhaP-type Na+/H+ or K+/H+ antiporter